MLLLAEKKSSSLLLGVQTWGVFRSVQKSNDELRTDIGEKMRLDPVILGKEVTIQDLLKYYMGKNTKERQDFIIENLRVEEDIIDA